MENYSEHLELAKKAALGAGNLILRRFGKTGGVKDKAPKDMVTDADVESERLIISMIKKKYPHHGFLAEESGKSGEESEYVWAIDPIDGTNNFAFGLPLFGVSIALLKNKQPVLGVINIPVFKELFHATRGGGAFMNGRLLHVSRRIKPDDMMVFYHTHLEFGKGRVMSLVEKLSESFHSLRMLGAATVHLTRIAAGVADAWVENNAFPWDIAAGCLIVEEAGGKATDFDGNPWTPWSKHLVVSNGKAHSQILEIARKAIKDA